MRRYLLVDDNAAVRRHLAISLQGLERRTMECVEVDSVGAAMSALAQGEFDAAFVSLSLAGGEPGLELVRRACTQFPELAVVVHTSRAPDDLMVKEAFSQGAFAYLAKPLRTGQLRDVLLELERNHSGAGSVR